MSKYVNEEIARNAKANGVLIGGVEPSHETKWTGWGVYANGPEIVACVTDLNDSVLCGEKIAPDELHLYVDDINQARAALARATGEAK